VHGADGGVRVWEVCLEVNAGTSGTAVHGTTRFKKTPRASEIRQDRVSRAQINQHVFGLHVEVRDDRPKPVLCRVNYPGVNDPVDTPTRVQVFKRARDVV
jgi:hypothetical protein